MGYVKSRKANFFVSARKFTGNLASMLFVRRTLLYVSKGNEININIYFTSKMCYMKKEGSTVGGC